jgi:hypothetical protein
LGEIWLKRYKVFPGDREVSGNESLSAFLFTWMKAEKEKPLASIGLWLYLKGISTPLSKS